MKGPIQVLLVEDNPGDALLIRETLGDVSGFAADLRHVPRLADALAVCASERVDLILLDLSLPDSSGLTTVERIQACAQETAVVVLSGLDDEDLAVSAVQEGAQDYLLKGRFDGQTLVRSIRYAMERKRAEDRLRRSLELLSKSQEERGKLLGRLVAAQEEERQRIAMGIHDDSIQAMTAAGMRLELLRRELSDPEQIQLLRSAEVSVADAIGRCRRLLFDLRPPALDRGLAPALRQTLDRLVEDTDTLSVELVNNMAEEPPEDVRVVLFRIAQEALGNARKHARAGRLSAELDQRDGGYFVAVQDNGHGFEPDSKRELPGHLGLVAMRERAELAGGWFKLSSAPNAGTRVEFWIPDGGADSRTGAR